MQLQDQQLWQELSYIDGQWVEATGGARLEVHNPASDIVIGSIPNCTAADTEAAISAAEAAYPAWRAKPAAERSALLERWYDLMLAHSADLAAIMTAEQGKPLAEAESEIKYAASFIRWFAEEGRRVAGSSVPAPDASRRVLILKQPVGVSAAITPWNFPSAMITRKCAPALAAGCTVVVKPSELTPYSALALMKLAERAGFPAGVINMVTGQPQAIGGALTQSPVVRKLSFTGSTRVGALLMRQCADTIKKLSLELGGNAPLIVFDDADIDLAIAATMFTKFRNAGQTCICANRIFVQDKVYDEFAQKLAAAVSKLKVGPGDQPGVTTGPLINAAAVQKVRAQVEDARALGASIYAEAENNMTRGSFMTPMVLKGANLDMRLAQEETFGPLAPLFRFGDEAEVIAMANATPYGLASYFFTENLSRSFRMAEALETGMVALNTGVISMEVAPFGGMKQSGLGREGGHAGIEEYLETKTFHIAGLK